MNRASYFLLDVFTDSRYGGNQLAIFPNAHRIAADEMQAIAAELNLSETVFLYPKNEHGAFPMKIFTPKMELPTAGHPSIGTGFFLAREMNPTSNRPFHVYLDQAVGRVKIKVQHRYNVPTMATMYQQLPAFEKKIENRSLLSQLLSVDDKDLMDLPAQIVSCGVPFLIVPLNSIAAIKKIKFRIDVWETLRSETGDAFIYTFALGGDRPGSDLHGRMFAPQAGILEDPATGAANGPLACYCLEYGLLEGPLISEQGFEMNRPSILHLQAKKENGLFSEVTVSGKSVFVGKGEFFLD